MYKIVVFTDENEVAVIPDNWLDGTSCSLWPPYKNSLKISKAVRLRENPDLTWKSFPIREIGDAETYERAMEKLTIAEDTSDLDSSNTKSVDSKRKRRRPCRFEDDESEDEVTIEPSTSKPSPRSTLQLPSPPTTPTTPAQPLTFLTTHSPPSNFRPPTAASSVSNDACVRILTLLEQLRLDIKLIIKLLNKQRNNEIVDDDITTIPEDLPASSMEQIDNIEKWLKETDANEKALICKLSLIGGNEVKETTRRIMASIISNKLSLEFNWMGKGVKRSFRSLTVCQVIIKSVRKHIPKTSDKEVENTIKDWLRGAGDRNGGRKKRARDSD